MKLFVLNTATGQREFLNVVVASRQELANYIGSPWFNLNGNQYHVHQVIAIPEKNNSTAGAVIGGLIGLLGGPYGALAGGVIGGALGLEGDKSEDQKVNYFNQSSVLF